MVAVAVAAVLASWAFNALVYLVWRPRAITRQLRGQGVGGPAYKFLAGNLDEIKRLLAGTTGAVLDVGSHDFVPRVQPHFRKWIPIHGRTFLYWFGARPSLCVADVNMVKQVLSDRSGMYPKNVANPHIARLLGKGLVLTDSDEWKRHRKVIHPAFNMDKLKDMKITLRGSTLVHNLDNPNIQEHCLTPASLECKTMERVLCRCFTPTHFLRNALLILAYQMLRLVSVLILLGSSSLLQCHQVKDWA